jgi:hypothetical protein
MYLFPSPPFLRWGYAEICVILIATFDCADGLQQFFGGVGFG